MKGGGIARALFDWATVLVGRMPGGLPIAAILATARVRRDQRLPPSPRALAMGTMVVPLLTERGYDRRFVLGLVASAGTLGILIPPSLPLVVYGLVSETSGAAPVPGRRRSGADAGPLSSPRSCWSRERRAVAGGAVRSLAEALPWGRTTVRAVPAVSVAGDRAGRDLHRSRHGHRRRRRLPAVAALAVNQLIYRSVKPAAAAADWWSRRWRAPQR